ncbi:MAG: hypothetical protein OXE83_12415 [Gammaproteobacteria bacterium]|nr:hypothetical protein [Gammaproteobacteria bacterium]
MASTTRRFPPSETQPQDAPIQAALPLRVELCAQGLLLEDHGYRCSEGVLYFAGSKERVRIPFDEELRSLTR